MRGLPDTIDVYEHLVGRWSRKLARELVEFGGLLDGEIIVDVGTGAGALIDAALDARDIRVVVGLDLRWPFLSHVRHRYADDPRVVVSCGDARRLPFGEGSFDRSFCLLTLPFVGDQLRAVLELRRVTRRGGAVVACCWQQGGFGPDMIFWRAATRAASEFALPPPMLRQPSLGPEGLRQLWIAAGLTNVRIRPFFLDVEYESCETIWSLLVKSPGRHRRYLMSLSKDQQGALRAFHSEDVATYREGGAIRIPSSALQICGSA